MIKAGVVVFPGSNCDRDVYYALKKLNFDVDFVFHKEKNIFNYRLIVLPGGFSYGDYLRPGAIAKFSPIMESIYEFIEKEMGLLLGICNGFQILTEANILEGGLLRNVNNRFICKLIEIKVINNDSPFTKYYEKGEILKIPIAHSDGRYFHENPKSLYKDNLVCFEYVDNPNGSIMNIAGILNRKFNVLGLMPHPERRFDGILSEGSKDGYRLFKSIYDFLK
ncbi:MAG: phosphoribosylformylglycinamidine synthase subunit PurQ [candidate division WOR-3 bacterium]|nr:phosphoribosylformylglycinamidine synthase subunit PurQ [candidate division WOR-3 bacterium]